jgi:hypothetical protein
MYYQGQEVAQSNNEAVKWPRKASEQGVADASYTLGLIEVIQRDKEASVQGFGKAFEQGYLPIDLITKAVLETIPNEETALSFALEELEGAQNGNEDAKKFVKDSGFLRDEYEGAMKNSSPEIDGPFGPQQTLTSYILNLPISMDEKARVRVEVVKRIINIFKLDEQSEL